MCPYVGIISILAHDSMQTFLNSHCRTWGLCDREPALQPNGVKLARISGGEDPEEELFFRGEKCE